MGIITFAFGMGGPLANFAGLLHMTMHSLTKSAIFFAVGHIAQVKGTQRIADIKRPRRHAIRCWPGGWRSASSRSPGCRRWACSPASSWCQSTFARQPLLAIPLVLGLLVAFGALMLRLQGVAVRPSRAGPPAPVAASYVPLLLHLALVLVAGLWLPRAAGALVRAVAGLLG